MTKDQDERLVVSFERIASALEGIYGSTNTAVRKLWPEREHREAVVTRVPNEQDRIREQQGASDKPVAEWLSEDFGGESEEEFIGNRERAFLKEQRQKRNASAQTAQETQHNENSRSSEKTGR